MCAHRIKEERGGAPDRGGLGQVQKKWKSRSKGSARENGRKKENKRKQKNERNSPEVQATPAEGGHHHQHLTTRVHMLIREDVVAPTRSNPRPSCYCQHMLVIANNGTAGSQHP